MNIQFIDLASQYESIKDNVLRDIQIVLSHGKYIMGPEVLDLEEKLKAYVSCEHALGVSSGTDALVVPLLAAGVGPGDCVFLPAFTYTATAEAVLLVGASPVFVDVDERTFNMDLTSLEKQYKKVVSKGELKPRVVLTVDLFGQLANYNAISPWCKERDLMVLADSAQAFGGSLNGRFAGAFGDVTATSFYPSKPLGCYGDGGAVFTNDGELAEKMSSVRTHGKGSHKYDVVRVGMNARLDTLQAAVLINKLSVFDKEMEERQRVAAVYEEGLATSVQVPHLIDGAVSAWAQYTVRVRDREALVEHLQEKKIPSMVFYPRPMHFQPPYAPYGEGPGSMPVSEMLCGEVLSLPMNPYLSSNDQQCVVNAINEFYG